MAPARHKKEVLPAAPHRRFLGIPVPHSRLVQFAVPAAAVATAAAVSLGVASSDPGTVTAQRSAMSISAAADREKQVSRSQATRPALKVTLSPKKVKKPAPKPAPEPVEPEVVDSKFLTTALNLWTGPGEDTTLLDVLPAGTEVGVTGRVVEGQWAEVVSDGKSRWVNAAYLADEKPEPEPEVETTSGGGISYAPCASGSSVESGLTENAIKVHRAVCAEFPQVSSYGGLRGDGEHGQGRALDIMVSGSLGDSIADFVRANSGALGVSEVLWSQQIWTVQRSSEGWRYMEDRGSTTANHYDHVHVTVY